MTLVHFPATGSEFRLVGKTGECGEESTMDALHALSPGIPENAAELQTISDWEIGHKQASTNGSEPLSAIADYLTSLGCTIQVYHYAEPFPYDWQAILKQHAGVHPVICEEADAGAGGGDESGVKYHFTCQLDALLFADGDNAACFGGYPVAYSLAQLAAKRICGLIVLLAVPASWQKWSTPMWVQGNDKWWTWTANDSGKGMRVGDGLHVELVRQGWDTLTPLHGEDDWASGAYSAVVVGSGVGAHAPGWDHHANTPFIGQDAAVAAAFMTQSDGLAGQLKSSQAQVAALAQQVATLQAQLKAALAQASQPPTPAPAPLSAEDQAKIALVNQLLAVVKAG